MPNKLALFGRRSLTRGWLHSIHCLLIRGNRAFVEYGFRLCINGRAMRSNCKRALPWRQLLQVAFSSRGRPQRFFFMTTVLIQFFWEVNCFNRCTRPAKENLLEISHWVW